MPNLSKVYDSCEMTQAGVLQFAIGYQWTNGLLYIDNAECTWKLLGIIPIASMLSEEETNAKNIDEQTDSVTLDVSPSVLNTEICQDAIFNWLDISDRLDPIPKDVVVKEDLFRQKNYATLTLLNHCNVESLSVDELQKLRYVEKENEN